jgi:hypothetical protein
LRLNELRKSDSVNRGIVIDHMRGFLVVEPVGSEMGDGEVVPLDIADYELRPVWCFTPPTRLSEARKLLGLANDPVTSPITSAF